MARLGVTIRTVLGAALAAAILAAGPAAAVTRWVDAANTTGVEDGTAAAPFSSIQAGVDAAVAGDVVSVAPGLYYENVTLKDLVDVVGQRGPGSTIIDGGGGNVVGTWFQVGAVRATVDGFTIRNGSYLVYGVTAWTSGYNRITVRNCVLRDGWAGVRASTNSQFTLERVVIFNTYQAISSIWGSGPVVRNVTIDLADQGLWSYQTSVALHDTTMTNVRLAMWAPFSGSAYGSHNNFYGYGALTDGNFYSYLADSVSVDPLFQAPPDDFRLRAGSPLIDAGVDVGLPFYGAAPDIGAYEWMPSDPAELVAALAVSIREAPPAAFLSPGEQRRRAVYQQLMAVMHMFESVHPGTPAAERRSILTGVAAKLRNDILAKADGFYGGNPANDWIVSKAEQDEFYPRVKQVLDTIEAMLAAP